MSHNKSLNILLMSLVLCISSAVQVFCYCDPTNRSSDDPMAIEAEYNQNEQVFIGEVIRIDPLNDFEKTHISSDRLKVSFKIEKQYKGGKAEQISLFEFSDGYQPNSYYSEDQSLIFEIGKKYLVYAQGGYGQVPLQTGLSCSRTKLLSGAEKDMQTLERIVSDSSWKFDKNGYEQWKNGKH